MVPTVAVETAVVVQTPIEIVPTVQVEAAASTDVVTTELEVQTSVAEIVDVRADIPADVAPPALDLPTDAGGPEVDPPAGGPVIDDIVPPVDDPVETTQPTAAAPPAAAPPAGAGPAGRRPGCVRLDRVADPRSHQGRSRGQGRLERESRPLRISSIARHGPSRPSPRPPAAS